MPIAGLSIAGLPIDALSIDEWGTTSKGDAGFDAHVSPPIGNPSIRRSPIANRQSVNRQSAIANRQ
ncbi:MAG: hypothetical protein A3H96_18135 [Acidobacteria bacterium RIFCSPLOWO2_02_FULL_67_36]|nr:MAG: hypothetical protein A3H96_18135 [Acidobacteria bacterium RIFCSPLOWO2_02_FULL_67_36]OFW23882.1 MAG: hypothetical protein A3G21_03070 [Acidobacteria bacterium RIFCSPLOWO2_12_FULL_66_21]